MNEVNKTLYIPLYGKAYVSKKGIILNDKKAEEIWEKEQFPLKGKSKSKWLAYYMGIRSAVFDEWLKQQMKSSSDAIVIHIGCGMDGRVLRIGTSGHEWYDVDFAEVIKERKRYYSETAEYKMLPGDARDCEWLNAVAKNKNAIVVMEGVSMYLSADELKHFVQNLSNHFEKVSLLMDCYTLFAAKMSKYKNPVKDVGVTSVYGIDDYQALNSDDLVFIKEYDMTPSKYIDELAGVEKSVFKKLYAGSFSKKLYRLVEYKK